MLNFKWWLKRVNQNIFHTFLFLVLSFSSPRASFLQGCLALSTSARKQSSVLFFPLQNTLYLVPSFYMEMWFSNEAASQAPGGMLRLLVDPAPRVSDSK